VPSLRGPKKQQNYSSAAPPKGRGILSVFLAGWNAISRGRIQSFAFRARDGSHLGRDRYLVTRRFKIAANGGSIIGSFIRGPRARGAHTKSQHYRAMRSAGFAWGGVGGQMERPPTWTELGLRWTARSRLNLPTPHYLPPTTASTIWCGTATSAIAAGKQGPQTTRGSAKVGSHPSCPRQYRSELAFVPRTSRLWSWFPRSTPTATWSEDLHFTG